MASKCGSTVLLVSLSLLKLNPATKQLIKEGAGLEREKNKEMATKASTTQCLSFEERGGAAWDKTWTLAG
eukprot:3819279-Amphidinium_carterae.1